jgi:hypothetical protein
MRVTMFERREIPRSARDDRETFVAYGEAATHKALGVLQQPAKKAFVGQANVAGGGRSEAGGQAEMDLSEKLRDVVVLR